MLERVHTGRFSLDDLSEHDVLSVQVGCRSNSDEKLGAVGVGSSVRL